MDQPSPVAELATLYEVARALLGARDPGQIASRVVLSGMGALGVRSGAMFGVDERGRYRLLYAAGLAEARLGEVISIPEGAREWMIREGAFDLDAASSTRRIGSLRDELVGDYDGAYGASIVDVHGLAGLLLFGPRLIPAEDDTQLLGRLESIASLAAQAIGVATEPDLRPQTAHPPAVRRPGRASRSLEALREAYPPLRPIIGESPALLAACQDLIAVAPTRFPVLLTGESGVGKEVAARAIRELSTRADGPFEVADCASIPRELIESELFGHVRGAFTGAHRDRRGFFELAHRGTLFLDEIGEMPLPLQSRLLRVLQEGRFRRVGDESVTEVDVRVIAASNRDLRAEVMRNKFREDLYYRLNVFAIRIPPLRERPQDLIPLLRHFLQRQGRELGVQSWEVDGDVLEAMERHRWPGNVRELANLCAGLAVQGRETGHVTLRDADLVWRRQSPGEDPPWASPLCQPRGQLGDWVLEQARAARFNLIEAERLLRRRKRAGHPVPLAERSALSYYLTGEILHALAETNGDIAGAALRLAGDADLVARVEPRVRKVFEVLRVAKDGAELQRRFAKLPTGYQQALERACRLTGS